MSRSGEDAPIHLSPRREARYIPGQHIRAAPGGAQTAIKDRPMAAIVALGLAFGIFAILNLIDNKRLD